eukprot:973983-Pelagomonas_calceolata.AAC.5
MLKACSFMSFKGLCAALPLGELTVLVVCSSPLDLALCSSFGGELTVLICSSSLWSSALLLYAPLPLVELTALVSSCGLLLCPNL